MSLNYLAYGPYCWGVAQTPDEAVRLAKQNWPYGYAGIKRPQKKHFSIYTSTGTFSINTAYGGFYSSVDDIKCIQKSILVVNDDEE